MWLENLTSVFPNTVAHRGVEAHTEVDPKRGNEVNSPVFDFPSTYPVSLLHIHCKVRRQMGRTFGKK